LVGGADDAQDPVADDEFVVAEQFVIGQVVKQLGNFLKDVVGRGVNRIGQLTSRAIRRQWRCHGKLLR
jgi:hypothetical protein